MTPQELWMTSLGPNDESLTPFGIKEYDTIINGKKLKYWYETEEYYDKKHPSTTNFKYVY